MHLGMLGSKILLYLSTGCNVLGLRLGLDTRFGNARTSIFKYSFWKRYVDSWNALSNDILDANNITKFKTLLHNHFTEL